MKIGSDELQRRLRTFGEVAEAEVPRINWGGCGVVAAIVGECLLELGWKCEVWPHMYRHEKTPRELREVCDPRDAWSWRSKGLNFKHFALRVFADDPFVWDTEGFYSGCKFGEGGFAQFYGNDGDGLTVAEIKVLADSPKQWNDYFDRKHIPTLYNLAQKHIMQGIQP